MLRQKRTTVGLLTWARSASWLTGRLANARGSPSTSFATRCSAGASEVIDALIRSSMGAPPDHPDVRQPPRGAAQYTHWQAYGSAFLGPAEAVARDHRARCARTPRTRCVGTRPAVVGRPVLHDRLDPAPRRLLFVAAH